MPDPGSHPRAATLPSRDAVLPWVASGKWAFFLEGGILCFINDTAALAQQRREVENRGPLNQGHPQTETISSDRSLSFSIVSVRKAFTCDFGWPLTPNPLRS